MFILANKEIFFIEALSKLDALGKHEISKNAIIQDKIVLKVLNTLENSVSGEII